MDERGAKDTSLHCKECINTLEELGAVAGCNALFSVSMSRPNCATKTTCGFLLLILQPIAQLYRSPAEILGAKAGHCEHSAT